MPKFRKPPVEVEAVQWTGENREEVEKMVGQLFDPRQVAITGDWVICDPDGKITALPPARFEANYEPVGQGERGEAEGWPAEIEVWRWNEDEADSALDREPRIGEAPDDSERFETTRYVPASSQPVLDVEGLLKQAHEAIRETAKALMTVQGQLEKPYEDDRRWSPWTRFIDRNERSPWSLLTKADAELSAALKDQEAGNGN